VGSKHIDTEKLAEHLDKYATLQKAVDGLGEEKSILGPEVQKLRDEKNELGASVGKLKQQKAGLEAKVKSLDEVAAKLSKGNTLLEENIKALESSVSQNEADIKTLQEKSTALNKELKALEQRRDQLAVKVKSLEETVGYKEALDEEIAELKVIEEKLRDRIESETKRLEVLDAFLGLVHATSREELQRFARALPKVLEEASEKEYSANVLVKYVFSQLVGKVGSVFSCRVCSAEFAVNRQPKTFPEFQCPVCGTIRVSLKTGLSDTLKAQLRPTGEEKVTD